MFMLYYQYLAYTIILYVMDMCSPSSFRVGKLASWKKEETQV